MRQVGVVVYLRFVRKIELLDKECQGHTEMRVESNVRSYNLVVQPHMPLPKLRK